MRMKKGDGVVFYSAREKYVPKPLSTCGPVGKSINDDTCKPGTKVAAGQLCQRFTAIGTVRDDNVYQVQVTKSWSPWRRDVEYVQDVKEVGIKLLVEELEFIKDKKNWGMSLRFGFLKIGEADWGVIQEAMEAT
jgi:hypothetical protein